MILSWCMKSIEGLVIRHDKIGRITKVQKELIFILQTIFLFSGTFFIKSELFCGF